MRVLGIDPGVIRLGLGVVETDEETRDTNLLYFGYFSHPRTELAYNDHLNSAISTLTQTFPKILHDFAPNKIAAELVPVGRLKSNSELVVAAITVCKVIAFQWGIPWTDYGANTIKKEVTDNGLATKAEVKNSIQKLFPELVKAHKEEQVKQKAAGEKKASGLPWDVYDGVAIALCGARK